jgi:hypothetical protein
MIITVKKISPLLFLVLPFLFSCNGNSNTQNKISEEKNEATTQSIDTVSQITENPQLDDLCSIISGTKPSGTADYSLIINNKNWVSFSSNLTSRFNKLDSSRISKIKVWRDKEIADVSKNSTVIFYPFSGPDFLNAFTFFPYQEKIYMFALEAPGQLPNIKDLENDTSYFSSIDKSLWSILNFSFFRTNSMKVDLKARDLNGAVHLISLFVKKTGNKILDIKPIDLDEQGKIISKKDSSKCFAKAIQIVYLNHVTNKNSEIFYFSCDLSDSAILKNNCLRNMIINLNNGYTTYLKSASYLLHNGNFSWTRKMILSKSKNILQDDSGIPIRFIDSTWSKTFFGTYDKPIPLFKNKFQEDLRLAYSPTNSNVKPLPFGIGYDYKLNESNLMLFSKRP